MRKYMIFQVTHLKPAENFFEKQAVEMNYPYSN